MPTIITHPTQGTHPNPDTAAQQHVDRLAKATAKQTEAALAFLSVIDTDAFEIAVTLSADQDPDDGIEDDPVPYAAAAAAWVASSSETGLKRQHHHRDGATSGAQEIYDPTTQPSSPDSWLTKAPEALQCIRAQRRDSIAACPFGPSE